MVNDSTEWISSLGLPRHQALLEKLIDYANRDARIRFVELGCSVARGAADELSDLDLGVGLADDSWPDALDGLGAALRGLGPVADILEHEVDSWAGVPHRRFFVQYADGLQIDLVAMRASQRPGLPAGNVALHDPDGLLAQPMAPRQREATPEQVREWAFEAYIAVLNADKYLRRGSLWEALEQVHQARTLAWRLWAVAEAIAFPAFGLTAILDEADVRVPPGLEQTVSPLDETELRASAATLLRVLHEVAPRAADQSGAEHPDRMAAFAEQRWETASRGRTS